MAEALEKWFLNAQNKMETAKKKLTLLTDALKEYKLGAEKKIIYVEVDDFMKRSDPRQHMLFIYFNDGSSDLENFSSRTILEHYRDYLIDEDMLKRLESE